MNKLEILKTKLGEGFKEHEVMRDHVSMCVGGVSDYYYEATTINDLIQAVNTAYELKIPYFILGEGSNILFSDYGFPGLIIKNKTNGIAFIKEKSQVIVDSGVLLQNLIIESASQDLSGLEFLYGIPGTLGGAIYGNTGAYNQSIGDYVKSITLLVPSNESEEQMEIIQIQPQWFEFGYRTSKIKNFQGYRKPVILSIKLQLAQSKKNEIIRRLNIYKNNRLANQPTGQTVGCIFKNMVENSVTSCKELPKDKTAGYVLDRAGAKKLRVGNARVSSKHANFIISTEDVKALEIRSLIEEMRDLVRQKNGYELEEEIEYIGQW